jgi:hypothetical protein
MKTNPELRELNSSLGRKTKITLLDSLKNVAKNVYTNKWLFIAPIVGYLAFSCATKDVKESRNLARGIDAGYIRANHQVENMINFLNSNPEFYSNPPIFQEAIQPVINSINSSLEKDPQKIGTRALELTQNFQKTIVSTNSTSQERIKLLEEMNLNLSKIDQRSDSHSERNMLLYILSIASVVVFALCDKKFKDYNSEKKSLRRNYGRLIGKLEKEINSSEKISEKSTYIGKFVSGLDWQNTSARAISDAICTFSESMKDENSDLLKVLAENPQAYIKQKGKTKKDGDQQTQPIEEIFRKYQYFKEQDKKPVNENTIKSRTELFLSILSKDPNQNPDNIQSAVLYMVDLKPKEIPDAISVVINGARNSQEILECYNFIEKNKFLNEEQKKNLVGHYLKDKTCPKITEITDIGSFGSYTSRKIIKLPLEEQIKFLIEMESFKKTMGSAERDFYYSAGYLGYKIDPDAIIELAMDIYKANPEFAKHSLLIEKLSTEDAEVCKEIYSHGFLPTDYLIDKIKKTQNKNEEIKNWKKAKEDIRRGEFNPNDDLMRNIEYTAYYPMAKKIDKKGSFKEYESIFSGDKK